MPVIIDGVQYVPAHRVTARRTSNFAARMRMAREQCGLALADAAEMANVTLGTVKRSEMGDCQGRFCQVAKLCQIYDVSLDWIAYGDDGFGDG